MPDKQQPKSGAIALAALSTQEENLDIAPGEALNDETLNKIKTFEQLLKVIEKCGGKSANPTNIKLLLKDGRLEKITEFTHLPRIIEALGGPDMSFDLACVLFKDNDALLDKIIDGEHLADIITELGKPGQLPNKDILELLLKSGALEKINNCSQLIKVIKASGGLYIVKEIRSLLFEEKLLERTIENGIHLLNLIKEAGKHSANLQIDFWTGLLKPELTKKIRFFNTLYKIAEAIPQKVSSDCYALLFTDEILSRSMVLFDWEFERAFAAVIKNSSKDNIKYLDKLLRLPVAKNIYNKECSSRLFNASSSIFSSKVESPYKQLTARAKDNPDGASNKTCLRFGIFCVESTTNSEEHIKETSFAS